MVLGGNRSTIPGWLIGSIHEELTMRLLDSEGKQHSIRVELPGLGFDISGGDIVLISQRAGRVQIIQNLTSGKWVAIASGCLIALLTVWL